MRIGIFFACWTLSVIGSVMANDDALIDKFVSAIPLHPIIRNSGIKAETTMPKITMNEIYSSPFAPLMDCSGNRTELKVGDFGTITSPNYPRNYPARVQCEWLIVGPPDSKIRAVMFDAVTQPWFFAYFDYVMIARAGNFSNVDRISGDMNAKTPMLIESEANKLGIRFRSSTLFNFRGFKLQYLVVPGDNAPPPASRPVFDGVCGQSVPVPQGAPTPAANATPSPSTEGSPASMEIVTPVSMVDGVDHPIINPQPQPMDNGSVVPGQNIIGGLETLKYAYPWMVALLIDNKHFCGGSLIDDQHVMTAAHCTDRASQITMLFGSHNIKSGRDTEPGRMIVNITRADIFQHPEYNGNTITYDISILRLPQKIKFTDKIKPVCLPTRDYITKFFTEEDTRVTGWGKPADNAAGVSPFLKEADVKVMGNEECRVAFRGIVTGNLICVRTTPISSPCKGDSGGPLMIKQTTPSGAEYLMQLGIVSFGSLTCERGLPVGFTRVTAFLDYINEITGKDY